MANFLAKNCEQKQIDLIFAGGLSTAEEFKKIQSLGINFAQIYTALIYQGPTVLSKILH